MPVSRFRVVSANDEGAATYSNTAWPPTAGTLTTNLGVQPEKSFSAGTYTGGVGLLRIDTSKLPDDATITSALLSLGRASVSNGADNKKLQGEYYDYGGDPAVAGDWVENVSAQIFTQVELEDFAAFSPDDTVKQIPLTDLTGINKSGFTGIRLALSSGTPTVVNRLSCSDLESALEITFTRASAVEVDVDAISELKRTTTTDPMTWTHTPNAAPPNGVLVAVIHGTSTTDHVSSVTYGGQSLTRIVRATDAATELGAAEWWFLGTGIPSGTATVSIDLASATTDDIHATCITLDGGGSKLEVVDFDSINDNVANPSVTLQYGGKQSMSFAALYGGGSSPNAFAENENCEEVHSTDFGAFYAKVIRQTTPGTSDFAIGGTASTDDVAYVAVAVRRVPPITGVVQQTFSFNVATAGKSTRFAAVSQTFSFNVATAGKRTTFGISQQTFSFSVSSAGAVDTTIRGAASTTFSFNVSADSKRERFAASSQTFTFGVSSAAVRGQIGQAQTTFAVGIASAGLSTRRGASTYGINVNVSTFVDPDYPILDPASEGSLDLTARTEDGLTLTAESEDSSLNLTPAQEQSP